MKKGYIKEPKGVDFIIQSEPYTDKERKLISEFIRRDMAKRKTKLLSPKRRRTIKQRHLVG